MAHTSESSTYVGTVTVAEDGSIDLSQLDLKHPLSDKYLLAVRGDELLLIPSEVATPEYLKNHGISE